VVGTPEQVTEELGRLNAAGMVGMIMGFLDYNEEMKYFGENVLPLMKQAGLRHELSRRIIEARPSPLPGGDL
jgi:FMNH2-dependent dimethyl sulfone monooxygenase